MLGKHPRKITTFQKCLPGESGGITIPGTIASVFGASSIGLTGFLLFDTGLKTLVFVIIAGVFGALMDSLFGATIQAQFKCPNCDKITEKLVHCDNHITKLHKGFQWINNDIVNLGCTLSGTLVIIILIFFI